jgi:type III restriction-modification system, res subunit
MTINNQFLEELSQYRDNDLRDYQEKNKQNIYVKWMETNTVLLQMPTGTGKTRLFVSIINDVLHYADVHKTSTNILVVAHRNELIEQITNELTKYGLTCSLIDAEHKYSHYNPRNICVASLQTLSRRMYIWQQHTFDIIIIDEAHHARGKSYRQVINTWKNAKILGLTATPYRMNDEGLAHEFKELVLSPSIQEFIQAGWLSNYDYYSISEDSEIYRGLSSIPLDSYGDYQINGLWRYCKKNNIRAEIVGSYLKFAKGKKGIVYTINKAHNHQLCSEFRRCGITAYGIDSDTKPEERKYLVQAFKTGTITILCNVNIFTEGFDCPDVEFIQLARPTRSLGLYLQQVGRGLRISKGKDKVIFIDNVGLYNRFGVPSAKRQWGYHFVGKNATDYGLKYAEEIDSKSSFQLKKRNTDLSEGLEQVKLIESTGLNEINKSAKEQYDVLLAQKIKPIIDSIYLTNNDIYQTYIAEFDKEPHLRFSAKVYEDLLVPCPFVDVVTDNIDYINDRILNEYKPVIIDGEIEYTEFKDWEDFASFKKDYIKKIFKKKLIQAQKTYMEQLKNFTIGEIKIYFENHYGENHHMTKKLAKYCLNMNFDDKWQDASKNSYIKYFCVETKRQEGFITYTSCEYYEQ